MEVKDVPASKLLRRFIRSVRLGWSAFLALRDHLLTADDARVIAERSHVLRRGVGVQRIHVPRGTAIPDKIGAP